MPGFFVDHTPDRFAYTRSKQALGDVLPIGDERTHSFGFEQKMQYVLCGTFARRHINEAIFEETVAHIRSS